MRTLYFDCFAGASGNMILGGLIALGVDAGELKSRLRALDLPNFELEVETVDRSGISATHVKVLVPDQKDHRHLSEIRRIIAESRLSDAVKARSTAIFDNLGRAEARVHGIDIEKVHFHEVGALDAIVDIIGSCIGFEMLAIDGFACSKIHVGSGFVEMAHGKFPVPPPAVVELLAGIPVYSTEISGELITPTGAAIIATLSTSCGQLPDLIVEQNGYGAGTRSYEGFPNALRLMIGEARDAAVPAGHEDLVTLEANIDDLSPQVLGYVMDRAFALDALDCWFAPIQMKKNRPAVMLSVLCTPADVQALSDMIYRETTTLGIRRRDCRRECLDRETVSVNTRFGAISVKVATRRDEVINIMPEYEDVRAAALKNDMPFNVVHQAAIDAATTYANSASAGK